MIKQTNLEQLQNRIEEGETCVVNLTADWCSDCTDQSLNLQKFSENLAIKKVAIYTLVMQQEKNIYLSAEHQRFTELLGGHGFPRTVLIINGKVVDADNVEIISTEQLTELAKQFIEHLA